jgi:serine/threonine protein phosphatase PrpC
MGREDNTRNRTPPDRRLDRDSSHVEVDVAGLTHPGRVRPINTDHFLITRFDRGMRMLATNVPEGGIQLPSTETGYVMLVADGVGVGVPGVVASRTAIAEFVGLVLETPDWIMRVDEVFGGEVLRRMTRRFQRIQEVLIERGKLDPALRGMSTTLTLACSLGGDFLTAHLGDSAAFLFRQGRLRRLPHDQTMAEPGGIGEEGVAEYSSPQVRTIATTAGGALVRVELTLSSLADGDQVLLCTDGLTELVAEEAIAQVLSVSGSANEACRRLVDLALDGGGKDNVTVVLGRYRIPHTGSPRSSLA